MAIPVMAALAATQTAANIGSSIGTGIQNRKQRKWNEKMYQIQRQDALADWNMQNAYNAPAAQMQRYKDAGLNPHLIYGQSNEGATVRSSNMQSWNPDQIPAPDLQGPMMGYFQSQAIQQQIDNMLAQKTVMEADAKLRDAQTLSTLLGIKTGEFDLGQKQQMSQFVQEAARLNLQKMITDIKNTETQTTATADANKRMNELQPFTIKKIKEETAAIYDNRQLSQEQKKEVSQRINNMITEGQLKEWELKMRKNGQNPNDPTWMKALWEEILKPIIDDVKSGNKKPVAQQFKEGFRRNTDEMNRTLLNQVQKSGGRFPN